MNSTGRFAVLCLATLFGPGIIEAVIGSIDGWEIVYFAIIGVIWLFWESTAEAERLLELPW